MLAVERFRRAGRPNSYLCTSYWSLDLKRGSDTMGVLIDDGHGSGYLIGTVTLTYRSTCKDHSDDDLPATPFMAVPPLSATVGT
eukprot:2549983-Rhodomonas_salina.3